VRYRLKDARLLAKLQASVDKRHGLGFHYSHSVKETPKETKAHSMYMGVKHCQWPGDIHFFDKAGRIATVARGSSVSRVTVSLKVQT